MNDFTVLCILDLARRRLVHIDRFNVVGWEQQVGRIAAALQRYNCAAVTAERNNVGDVVIEMMQARGVCVHAFDTSSASKPDLIDSLAVAFERKAIALPPIDDCRVLTNELMCYAYEKLPSGNWRMGAPSGSHDDCVMSLALAWRMTTRSPGHPIAGPERPIPSPLRPTGLPGRGLPWPASRPPGGLR
jgi:hypothetical protein